MRSLSRDFVWRHRDAPIKIRCKQFSMKRKTLFLGAVPFLVLNGFFVANLTRYPELRKYADRPELAIVSAVFVVIFALPSFLATLQWLGARRGALALIALGAFAFCIETLALNSGMPYGAFSYGEKIGAKCRAACRGRSRSRGRR